LLKKTNRKTVLHLFTYKDTRKGVTLLEVKAGDVLIADAIVKEKTGIEPAKATWVSVIVQFNYETNC
jgi:hypothetical protein